MTKISLEYLYIIIVLKLMYIRLRYTTIQQQVTHPDTFQISDHKNNVMLVLLAISKIMYYFHINKNVFTKILCPKIVLAILAS